MRPEEGLSCVSRLLCHGGRARLHRVGGAGRCGRGSLGLTRFTSAPLLFGLTASLLLNAIAARERTRRHLFRSLSLALIRRRFRSRFRRRACA